MTPHRPRANRRLQAFLTAAIGQYFGIPREALTITIILETAILFRGLEARFIDHVERVQRGVAGEEAHGMFLACVSRVFRGSQNDIFRSELAVDGSPPPRDVRTRRLSAPEKDHVSFK